MIKTCSTNREKVHSYNSSAELLCRIISFILTLSIVTSVGAFLCPVFAEFDAEPFCGMPEHAHTKDCYDSITVCGFTDDDVDHEHSEDCFYPLLTCNFDAHTHTEACFTPNNTDVDTDADESGDNETIPPISDGDPVIDVDDLDVSDGEKENNNDVAAIAEVNEFEPDTIYYRVKRGNEYVSGDENTYVKNDGKAVDVYVGDVIEFIAILDNPNRYYWDGSIDTSNERGSGLFNFESDYLDGINIWAGTLNGTTQWAQVGPNHWKHEKMATARSIGTTTVYLAKNGNQNQNTLRVNVVKPTFIHVHNIRLGNMEYDDIDVHTVTRMMDWIRGENNANSRYIIYVGQTLALSASAEGSFSPDVNDDNGFLRRLTDTGDITDESNVPIANAAKYLALKPGNCEITFTDPGGKVLETFYIEIRYPIYVKTFIGEYHKNRVHEYLADLWEDPKYCITDPFGSQIYIKNSAEYPYILLPDSTVELVVYAPIEEYHTAYFTNPRGVEFEITGEETGGDFVKITAVVKANSATKAYNGDVNCEISFDGPSGKMETFYIQYKNGNDWWASPQTSQHFDIEIGDGGTYTSIYAESKFDEDGKEIARYVTEIVYSTMVSHINYCQIFAADGRLLEELEPWEYCEQGAAGEDSQYELTSAWATKKKDGDPEGKLVGDRINGMATRSVNTADIDHVNFNVNLKLFPKQRTLTIYTIDPDNPGKWKKGEPTDLGIDGVENSAVNGYEHTMVERDIIDALNKCPNHSGLDFTLMTSENSSAVKIKTRKILTGRDLKDGEFTFQLYRDNRSSIPPNERPDLDNTDGITLVEKVKNDADGNVIFSDQDCPIDAQNQFYTFYIREEIPPNAENNIIYDTRIIKLTVSVQTIDVEGEDTRSFVTTAYYYLEDDISGGKWEPITEGTGTVPQIPTFYNKLRLAVTLPATGGTGTYAYTAVGVALIMLSFVPICVRRRRYNRW